jgi:hypothetical protein
MTEPARRPSGWWYAVGAAIIVLGCGLSVWHGRGATHRAMAAMERHTAPGEWDVQLTAGRTSFFVESPGAPPQCTLTGPPRAKIIFEEPPIVQRYDRGGYVGRSFRQAEVDEDGTYHLACTSADGPKVVASGDGFSVRNLIPAIIGSAASIFLAVPIMAFTLIRRRSRNRPDYTSR